MNGRRIILILLLIILIGLFGLYMYLNANKLYVEYEKNVTIELGKEVYNTDYIIKVVNGKIITKRQKIDTSKIGKQQIDIVIKDKLEKMKEYKIDIEVIDNIKPIIKYIKEISTTEGITIDLLKNVSVEDNYDKNIKVEVLGEYDFNKVGEYTIYYYAKDKSGNETKEQAKLKVIKKVVEEPISSINKTGITSKGYKIETINGVTYVDGTLIANKTYALPASYGNGITKTTMNAFNQMKQAAAKDGVTLTIVSGFRSYNTQKTLYNNYVNRDGKKAADTYSARPGYSEHQSGLGMDLNQISDTFGETKAGKWLANNSYKYGFILRYPKGKDTETGYMYESWHFRYVGVELATKLFNNGDWLTLESYYGITSQY